MNRLVIGAEPGQTPGTDDTVTVRGDGTVEIRRGDKQVAVFRPAQWQALVAFVQQECYARTQLNAPGVVW